MTRTRLLTRSLSFLLLFTLVIAPPGSAQLGLKGGVSFATLSNATPDLKTRTGFAGGVALSFGRGTLALQPEVLFVRKSAAREPTTGEEPAAVRTDYLEIPVLLRLNLPVGGVTAFGLGGGLYDLLLNCDLVGGACPNEVSGHDFGVVLGGGIKFGGRRPLSIEGRYTWGLTNISELSSGLDQKTRTFMILAGIGL